MGLFIAQINNINQNQEVKMKKLNLLTALVLFCFSLLVISSCSKKKSEIIKIGVIGPLTGEGATYGAAMKRGIDLAFEDANSEGGILGKKVKAIYEDSRLSAKDAINAFNKLVNQDKVQVIIGAAASKVTLNLAPFAEKNKVVLISSISTADKLKYSGDYIFRDVPPNLQQGITAAKFVNNVLKKKKVAVFYKNDDYGISLSKAFLNAFKAMGNNILIVDSYQPNETDYRNQLSKIKSNRPEAIFFPGNYEDSGKILKQARELDINAIFVGGDGSYSPQLIKIAGKAAENSYYTIMALPSDTSKVFSSFKEKYVKEYKEEPDVYSVYSYDAAMVILEAIRAANNYDGSAIKDALYKIKYNGITGLIKFDKFGEVNKDYAIYVVKNGNFELFY